MLAWNGDAKVDYQVKRKPESPAPPFRLEAIAEQLQHGCGIFFTKASRIELQ
jgi:hypothetical protein